MINIRWLAPEVFKTKQLTETTDVFAFGITLYEIFTGNLPYFSMSFEEIQNKLIAGHRIRPETRDIELPRNVLKLMRRCWRTNVNERPTMDGVWLELRNFYQISKKIILRSKEVKPEKLINIRWLAPEVFKTKQLTETTDVFAFGITLYEIFTGNLPYFSMSFEEIQNKLIAGHRIRPETRDIELPRNVLKLMRRCWRTNVNERPTMDGVWLELRVIRNNLIFKQQCAAKFNFQEKTI
ncbi:unnamed protein product [Wuchereria bancrofti]|uniref:Protein kinase domain-containing protein n=1 Tax=Wuchereria bancrofti TaxID=6293 RepID=A0A3P7FWI4_WUCBA|nr:unnamed protein product [Wuchereria bancrofti]